MGCEEGWVMRARRRSMLVDEDACCLQNFPAKEKEVKPQLVFVVCWFLLVWLR